MLKCKRVSQSLIKTVKFSFLPPSCYEIHAKVNPVIKVTLGNDEGAYCDLHFRLFENVVPKTAENFKRLLLGNAQFQGRNLTLAGTGISRHVQRSFIQFGNMADGNCSIFGPKFRDESFELLHDRPGLLTSISEQNTNNSRFALTLQPCPFMDLKNVVFGEVTPETFGKVRELERLGSRLLTLRILSSELLKTQASSDDHHHHEDVQVFPDPQIEDPLPRSQKYTINN